MENKNDPCFVLLLDDDEDDFHLAKSIFEEAFGNRVKLDWFQRDHFSTTMICSGFYAVTLVDYRLGMEDGVEVIRKAKEECPKPVVFLVTSWPDPDIENRAASVGADGYLNKNDLSTKLIRSILDPYLCPEKKV